MLATKDLWSERQRILRASVCIDEDGYALWFEVEKPSKTYETQNLSEAIREFNRKDKE